MPIKVKCVKENIYGLSVGKIYDAYKTKSDIKCKNDYISVMNDYGEEYLCPKSLFEIAYRETDDDFEAIKQKYGHMTAEGIDIVLKAEEERIKKLKEVENKEQK